MSYNSALCRRADDALSTAPDRARTLILIHAGVIAILALLVSSLDFTLDTMMDNTTAGLSGMGARALLSTVQSVLRSIQQVAMPFWNFGYLYATIGLARKQNVTPVDLLMGFKRIPILLLCCLFMMLVLIGVAVAASYASIMLLSLTPLAGDMTEIAQEFIASGASAMDDALAARITEAAGPLMIAATIAAGLAVLFISYRFRLVFYCALDDPKSGAGYAMAQGRYLMRGNKKKLFLLDLHFWWYYLAIGLLTVIAYGDLLLPRFGISLPFGDTTGFFLFYIVYLIGQFALSVYCKNRVNVAYALFYEDLKSPQPQAENWNPVTE